MIAWLARGKNAPVLEDKEEIDRIYKRSRRTMLVALTLGYGFSYTCRLGLSVVKKPLIEAGIFTTQDLGKIGAAYLFGYGFGKLINGFIADRTNISRFFPLGLFLSALINLAFSTGPLAYVAIALWALNGWFQGHGAPSSVIGITQWFTGRERGTAYGVWSASHSLGEGITFAVTASIVAATAWQAAFITPGIFCIVIAVALFVVLKDHPGTLGLPPIHMFKPADYNDGEVDYTMTGANSGATIKDQLSIFKMPSIYLLGLSSALMYVTRYAVNSWGMLYLQGTYDYSQTKAGLFVAANALTGITGSIVYGWVSDRFFKGRRPPLTLLFGCLEIGALLMIFFSGSDTFIALGFVLYGFTLSGILAVLGGLMAVDICSKRTAGFAMGVVGCFSYIGAGAQEIASGYLIETFHDAAGKVTGYDFGHAVWFWVGSSVLSMLLATSLWNVKSKE